jgi:hypothetical protein
MSGDDEKELRRLTDQLRVMASSAESPEQVEALRQGAAALCLVFSSGSWQELKDFNGPLTEEMKVRLRKMGIESE